MKITIERFRVGFATNSSSSHSMIILPKGSSAWLQAQAANREGDCDYGWENFTLASARAKAEYVGTAIYASLNRGGAGDDNTARMITSEIMAPFGDFSPKLWGYIDHQSDFSIPFDREFNVPHREYLADLMAYLSREDLVILGGNDNDGEHPLEQAGESIDVPWGGFATRLKKDGDWWTLFSGFGNKTRMSFKDNPEPFVRSQTPDLVDLKITDYCTFGCNFCYQASTPEGLHADLGSIERLAFEMGEAGVFEVAIGGGEPTMHPQFKEILRAFSRNGVVPNFTTRNLPTLLDPEIMDLVGSVGVSIDSAEHMGKVQAFLTKHAVRRVTLQYVMGSTPITDYQEILKGVKVPLLLLGYKTVGRGETFVPHDYKGWFKVLEMAKPSMVSIDTMLAGQSTLDPKKVAKFLYSTKEGQDNMYIDAVKGTCGPSSFCEPALMKPLTESLAQDWADCAISELKDSSHA